MSPRQWRSPERFKVELVTLTYTTHCHDGEWLVVTHPNGMVLAQVRNLPGSLAVLADALGGLVEVDPEPLPPGVTRIA
jgi:hypothetical protein